MKTTRTVINAILICVLLLLVSMNWTLGRDPTQRTRKVFTEMARSVAYESQSPNPNFSDGKTQQPPVPGTIARGFMPLHYTATDEDALRAGEELSNPLDADDPNIVERGRFVFNNFCISCHGPSGQGDGLVAQRGFPPPPSLLAENAVQMKEGTLFHALTYGKGNMPSHRSQLSRLDRWAVITFVKQFQRDNKTKDDSQPMPEPIPENAP